MVRLFTLLFLTSVIVGEEIRIMPVAPTPESNSIVLAIAVPKENEVLSGNRIWIQFRIDGYSLGSDSSQFVRANQIPNTNMGQTVHVIVDNEPYFAVNEPAIDPFNETGYFYNMSYKFELPYRLKEGAHSIRMFAARAFGESIKSGSAFATVRFYVGGAGSKKMDFSQPFLTYNEPEDEIPWNVNQPVLLDFLIANCELTPDGYNVRLTIDGKTKRTITSWQPYYIYGLSKGEHSIRLQLMNKESQVPGLFNDVTRSFTVQ